MKLQSPSVRLYALIARTAPTAVIFRRGPSKQVLLIKWNLLDDTFECGQWLKGRIYERRCDLSPDGTLLVYFAASQRPPYGSWTAISRPPHLTALALWPKGDCWGGGGQFLSSRRLALNHRTGETNLADQFALPAWLKIEPFGARSGWGEDDPIWSDRLARDGWKLICSPTGSKDDFGAKVMHEFSPPIQWHKPHPKLPKRYTLEMQIIGIYEKNGPWYLIEHSVMRNETAADKIGRTDWADWSPSGDLLFAMDGCLYRLPISNGRLPNLETARKIADFTNTRFENRAPAPEALRWPKPK